MPLPTARGSGEALIAPPMGPETQSLFTFAFILHENEHTFDSDIAPNQLNIGNYVTNGITIITKRNIKG